MKPHEQTEMPVGIALQVYLEALHFKGKGGDLGMAKRWAKSLNATGVLKSDDDSISYTGTDKDELIVVRCTGKMRIWMWDLQKKVLEMDHSIIQERNLYKLSECLDKTQDFLDLTEEPEEEDDGVTADTAGTEAAAD